MITLNNAINSLIQDDVIKLTPVYKVNRNTSVFKLLSPIKVKLSDGTIITIPKGFTTDLSSVPNFLWFAFSPYGNFLLAAIIHDFIYVYKTHTRKFADKEMLIWSNKINPKNKFDNYVRYYGVRLFGGKWYNKNSKTIN